MQKGEPMKKLIYLEDAIDALERKKDKNAKGDIGGFYNKIIQNDIDTLMQMSSAQSEIIHCKECMNHGKEICYFWSHFYGTINTPDDGFCYKAERRTDE